MLTKNTAFEKSIFPVVKALYLLVKDIDVQRLANHSESTADEK